MKIENHSIYKRPYNTTFTSCMRGYKAVDIWQSENILGGQTIYTKTNLFRNHINWKQFISYVVEHFKDKPKVKVCSLGGSDGSEAYSYAISFVDQVSESQLKKYFPIISCDIDPEIIRAASTGRINLEASDLQAISDNIINTEKYNSHKNLWENFFRQIGDALNIKNDMNTEPEIYQSIYNPIKSYIPIGSIKDSVKFYESDILSEINCLNDEGNSIINTCHVLGYCNEKYVNKVIQTLGNKLKTGSIYVFDKNYQTNPDFIKQLENQGFWFPDKNACFAQKM